MGEVRNRWLFVVPMICFFCRNTHLKKSKCRDACDIVWSLRVYFCWWCHFQTLRRTIVWIKTVQNYFADTPTKNSGNWIESFLFDQINLLPVIEQQETAVSNRQLVLMMLCCTEAAPATTVLCIVTLHRWNIHQTFECTCRKQEKNSSKSIDWDFRLIFFGPISCRNRKVFHCHSFSYCFKLMELLNVEQTTLALFITSQMAL